MFINSKLYLQLCGRENSIDILPESIAKYNMSDNNKFKTIVVFDCRGLEPVDFSPRNGWKVRFLKYNRKEDFNIFSSTRCLDGKNPKMTMKKVVSLAPSLLT